MYQTRTDRVIPLVVLSTSMTADAVTPAAVSWAERVADRSETVQRSRARQIEQAHAIVAAARRLIDGAR